MPWRLRAILITIFIILRELVRSKAALPNAVASLRDREARILSQNGEDGVIASIFAEIGFSSRRFCEFGFSASQCNALLLVRRHRFAGLWIDADRATCDVARTVGRLLGWRDVRVLHDCITRDNINPILAMLAGDDAAGIDLLSIDIDGIDYWVLDAVEGVRPRVLVLEYNAVFGPDRAVTVPYDDTFDRFAWNADGLYFGASLAALERLAAGKGYRLLGTESSGTNAFFVDAGIAAPSLPTVTAAQCWHPMAFWTSRGRTMEECFTAISDLPLIEV